MYNEMSLPFRIIIDATMSISDRPNRRRGMTRLTMRNGCHANRGSHSPNRAAMRPALADAVWDKDIAGTADGLDVQRNSRIVFNLPSQPRDLHVDGPLQLQIQFLAQQGAGERTPGIGCKQFHQLLFRAGMFHM